MRKVTRVRNRNRATGFLGRRRKNMKIGSFEIYMQNKGKTSIFIAILKTFGFFAIILGIIAASIYFGTGKSQETAKVETQSGYKHVQIDDLDDYDYYTPFPGAKPDPERLAKNQIPESVKNLNGTQISVAGFMMPLEVDGEGNVEEFVLNGSYDRCFYGAPSEINQWIHVKMHGGKGIRASHSPITVFGTFEVGELLEDGEVVSLYRMTGDKMTVQQRRLF